MRNLIYVITRLILYAFFITLFMGNRAMAMESVSKLFVGDQFDCRIVVSKGSSSYNTALVENILTGDFLPGKVVWSSSNPAVAHIDSNGVITAIRPGSTVITATIQSFKKKISYIFGVYPYSKHTCDYIAHRGYSSKAPGNSLAALRLAMEAGFDYVEFDIWPTKDKEFVVSHDNLLKKSCGMNKFVSDLSLEQVVDYNIIKGKGIKKYRNENIPSLEQVLSLAEAFPETKLSIEIKPELSDKMIYKLVKTVDEHGMMRRVKFISFHKTNLYLIRKCTELGGEDVMLGYLSHKPNNSSVQTCIELNAELGLNYKMLSNALVENMHDNGLRVNVWTVPNKSTATFLINTMKVDSITTDYKLFP